MNVNLKGTYLVTNAVLPSMIKNGKGCIIKFSSIAGFVAGGGGAAYTTSKHAIIGYTKQLSCDYGKKGIKANAICPGLIYTNMTKHMFEEQRPGFVRFLRSTPAGRTGEADEVASLAVYLASEESDFIHGAAIPIDGGWIAK